MRHPGIQYRIVRHDPPVELYPKFDGVNCVCDPSVEVPCLYRLYYGKKYIIWKGRTLDGSLYFFKNGEKYYNPDSEKNGRDKNNHAKIFDYIRDHPGLEYRVELIMESGNHYWLLREEYKQLTLSRVDPNCLNKDWLPHGLDFNGANFSVGWIRMPWWANYLRWESKHSDIRRSKNKKQRPAPANYDSPVHTG